VNQVRVMDVRKSHAECNVAHFSGSKVKI